MEYYLVSPLRVIGRVGDALTYHSEHRLVPGMIVNVSVGSKDVAGVVLRRIEKPSFQTKPVASVVTETPIPEPLLRLHDWLSTYYV